MRIALSVCLTLVLGGVAYAQTPAPGKGEKLFVDQKCSLCHSIAGKGNAKGPLDGVGAKRTAEDIRQWLINPSAMAAKTKSTRKPPMPSFAKLAKEDVEALVTYLMSLKK